VPVGHILDAPMRPLKSSSTFGVARAHDGLGVSLVASIPGLHDLSDRERDEMRGS
jgi:hypothetical protein